MADIAKEVESLRDFVTDLNFARIWMQHLPEKYTAGELSIRYIGDTSASETGYHRRYNRDYQFVYFAANELACIQKASELQRKLENEHKLRIKDSEDYLTLGSFSISQPFKTEGTAVFAFIGVLQAQVWSGAEIEEPTKVSEIDTRIQ